MKDLVKKHGCKACGNYVNILCEIAEDLIENGQSLIDDHDEVRVGTMRKQVGGILIEWAHCIQLDSSNSPLTAMIEEIDTLKDIIDKAVQEVKEISAE